MEEKVRLEGAVSRLQVANNTHARRTCDTHHANHAQSSVRTRV